MFRLQSPTSEGKQGLGKSLKFHRIAVLVDFCRGNHRLQLWASKSDSWEADQMLGEVEPQIASDAGCWFLHAANVLYIICYAVKDVLWLRIFCVLAILIIMPYYYHQHLSEPVWWNLAFLAINMFWIVVIIRERIPPRMTDQQKRLYSDVFKASCSPQDMLKLLSVATWVDCKEGDSLIENKSDPDGLILIDKGTASVVVNKKLVASLGRGDFVGEMSYLTNEPAVADVTAASPMTYIRWDRLELYKLFDGRTELKSAINEIIGRDLINKIGSSAAKVPELSVDTIVMKKS